MMGSKGKGSALEAVRKGLGAGEDFGVLGGERVKGWEIDATMKTAKKALGSLSREER